MAEEVVVNLIKLELTPEEVFESFPADFLGEGGKPEQGFAEKMLDVPISLTDDEIKFEVSYDGELELIAIIRSKPLRITNDEAKEYLLAFLDVNEDEDEDEDEDEEE